MAKKVNKNINAAHYVSFYLVVALHKSMVSMSWPCARRLALSAADLAAVLDRRKRKAMMARRLLEVFPHLAPPDIRKLVRDVYRSLFESIVDALHFHTRLSAGDAREHIRLINESGKPLPAVGQGIIFTTGHFGWWEVSCMAMAALGYRGVVIAREMKNPLIEDYISKIRESQGVEQAPKKGGIRRSLRALRNGKCPAMLIDQDARYHGIFVDFLGKPASTYPSPAQLSVATGTPVAFLYCLRENDSERFRVIIKDIIYPNPETEQQSEVLRITQRLSDDLAELVRAHPHRWLWLHRRWKTYPGKYKGHTGVY